MCLYVCMHMHVRPRHIRQCGNRWSLNSSLCRHFLIVHKYICTRRYVYSYIYVVVVMYVSPARVTIKPVGHINAFGSICMPYYILIELLLLTLWIKVYIYVCVCTCVYKTIWMKIFCLIWMLIISFCHDNFEKLCVKAGKNMKTIYFYATKWLRIG